MKSLVGGTAAALILVGLLTSACGDDDSSGSKNPQQACNDIAVSTCARAYECLTPDVIALIGWPATEAACVSQRKEEQGCDSITAANACEGNQVYHADQASKCVTQLNGASCSQILSSQGEFATFAPACDMICTVG